MVRQNSANKRARYEHGTDRLVKSYFHDEKSIQRRKENRVARIHNQNEWEKMSPEQRKQYVLNKYGPGKKHDNYIALELTYKNSQEFRNVLQHLRHASEKKPTKLAFGFIPDSPMRHRLHKVYRIVLTNGRSWIHLLFKTTPLTVQCSRIKKTDNNQFEYYVEAFVISIDELTTDPFQKWPYYLENTAHQNDKDISILMQPAKSRITRGNQQNSPMKGRELKLVVEVNAVMMASILELPMITLAGNISSSADDITGNITKFYCYSLETKQIIQADVAKSKSYITKTQDGYRYTVKAFNLNDVEDVIFDEKKQIIRTIDDKGVIVSIYK